MSNYITKPLIVNSSEILLKHYNINKHEYIYTAASEVSHMSSKKTWRKVLYDKQPYLDNYTDKKMFLRDLRKNIKFREITPTEAVYGLIPFVQELCTVVTFVIIYFAMLNQWIEPNIILKWSSCLTVILFLYYIFNYSENIRKKLGNDLRTVLTFIGFGQLFSPVLYTLTETISTDTIYTTTFLMMVIHLIFFDYGVGAAIVSKSLSFNAAIFASICLASRLQSAHHTFILMTIATEAFVLFPLLRTEMNQPILFSGLLLSIDIYSLYYISIVGLTLFLLTIILVTVICPFLFLRYQKHKDNIYGPWDEAVVDDSDNCDLTS